MSTEAQINANRQNAQRSTGPRTAGGKAAVSQNAIKHGLFARQNVLECENEADFDFHREQLLAEWAPVGYMESTLTERIVSLSWRLRRCERMHSEVMEEMIEVEVTSPRVLYIKALSLKSQGLPPDDPRGSIDHLVLGRMTAMDWSSERVLERLFMYERRIELSMFQTMNKLKTLQIMRRVEYTEASKRQHAADNGPVQDHTADHEKQSRSARYPLLAKALLQHGYESIDRLDMPQNKAKQSQFQAPASGSKGAGRRKVRRQAHSGSEAAG